MNIRIKKVVSFAILLFSVICGKELSAQNYNPIHVAVPSLQIAPDARGGGMGDIGAATMPDIYSQYWNPAKFAFVQSNAGISLSYTPWLRKLVKDIDLAYVTGFWKFGGDNLNAVSTSLRYFSLGEIQLSDLNGDFWASVAPYELAFDVAYSRKLTETFSGAVTLRYIYSDYSFAQDDETSPGSAFAADVAGYNESYMVLGDAECLLGLGFNISNIGTKISTDGGNTQQFIPTNFRLGASLAYPMDEHNVLSFTADINKLLVPTPPVRGEEETDTDWQKRYDEYNSISPIAGIFKSFADAPGGMKEEMQEIMWSVGAEYIYNNQFSVRGGYFNESEYKGNRKYFAFGAGFKMNVFQLDAAYLVSTAQSNPLDQTLRFSLAFDMDGLKSLWK